MAWLANFCGQQSVIILLWCLFVSHIRPIMDFCFCVWNVIYVMDVKLLVSVQRRWTREVAGVDHLIRKY